jgi:cyclopropane-fatty-acyl-phospholipid synthase
MASLVTPVGPDEAAATVAGLHRRLATAGLEVPVRLWDRRELGPPDAEFRLVLRHPASLRRLLAGGTGELAAAEAYLDDLLDVEGSMVAALRCVAGGLHGLDLGLRDRGAMALGLRRLPTRAPAAGAGPRHEERDGLRARLRGPRHSRRRDAAAVRHHYDVGNDFYRLFLDPELVYSCAVFDESERSRPVDDREVLATAQRRKLEVVCRKLRLRPGDRLVDIGCGWGALVVHAARHHGVEALGITLAEEQAALARDRVVRAGLSNRVRIEVADYRELDGRFDAIASVGMVEHVGADRLEAYAAQLYGLLAPGGRLLNHGITTGQRDVVRDFSREPDSFIARYVFPDGSLVPAHHMARALERAGFELWDLQQLRPHYARTLEHWVANLEAHADAARALVGERRYRVWRAYMAGSAVGFEHGDLGVVQLLGVRTPHRLPFGRAWMEPDGGGGRPGRPYL